MKNRTSTAGFTCFTRACASVEEDGRLRGTDDLAAVFLPGFARIIMKTPFLRRFFMHHIAPPGIYEYVIIRTKIFDRYFLMGLLDGIKQIVILGAGMDSRALRFAHRNDGTRIFEVDHPDVQNPKRDILQRKKIALPSELVFVGMDFNTQDLFEELTINGYDPERRTLFLWEGLCMYLQPESVDRMFTFIQSHSGAGSEILFDFVRRSVIRKEHTLYGEEQIYRTVENTGEGWTFGIDEINLRSYLSDRGFYLIRHITSEEMQREFLTAEDGSAFGRINATHHIAHARLQGMLDSEEK